MIETQVMDYVKRGADGKDHCQVPGCRHWHLAGAYALPPEGYWMRHMRVSHPLLSPSSPPPVPFAIPPNPYSAGGLISAAPGVLEVDGAAGLKAILAEIRKSHDSFKAAGEWLTKVTNAITDLLKEEESEEKDTLTPERKAEIDAMGAEAMVVEWRTSPVGRFSVNDPESEYFAKVMIAKGGTRPSVWDRVGEELGKS